jgi:hypothetical protein
VRIVAPRTPDFVLGMAGNEENGQGKLKEVIFYAVEEKRKMYTAVLEFDRRGSFLEEC